MDFVVYLITIVLICLFIISLLIQFKDTYVSFLNKNKSKLFRWNLACSICYTSFSLSLATYLYFIVNNSKEYVSFEYNSKVIASISMGLIIVIKYIILPKIDKNKH